MTVAVALLIFALLVFLFAVYVFIDIPSILMAVIVAVQGINLLVQILNVCNMSGVIQ